MSVASKVGSVGIYNKDLYSINSHNALVAWSCKVTGEILDLLCLYYHQEYGHQNWQGGYLL